MLEYKNTIVSGFKKSIPVIIGYIPIGISYGILALNTDLSPYVIIGMSAFVFAGSSQLIAVNMLTAQAAIIPIIMTTFLVNLRHILMSASLSLHFKKTPSRLLPLIGFVITDESFAIGNTLLKERENKGLFFLSMGLSAYLGWVLSSLVGVLIGRYILNFEIPVIDFVLPAMFIILLIMQIRDKMDVVVSVLAAILSIIFFFIFPGNWNIIIATLTAAVIGVIVENAV
ncbi:MAG: AzlC family ABC transporter permease [Halanaerobiales bacterium]|nr:AzlC family ABC transporter permease [Halanaerobiales bacterium]